MAKTKKTVRMADIAEQLKCSTVTVSKALSGQKGVSEELRGRIRETALKMGYKLPVSAAKNGGGKGYNIGVVLSGRYLANYDTFYWKMYQEIASRATQKECFTLFEIIDEETEKNKKLPKLLAEGRVDGLLVIGKPGYGYEEFLKKEVGLPLVFLDFYEPDGEVDCFVSDGFYGTWLLTNYLFQKGHRDIAYVGTLFSTDSITDRYLGYVKSLMEHGMKPKTEYLIADRDIVSGLRDNYGSMAFPGRMPTAFVCNCDFIASLVIRSLRKEGFKVPEDVSVVGYDNYLYPELSDIGITTYEVDIREMAKSAIRLLLKKLDGEPYKKGIHIIEGHLIEKSSVAERKKI